MSLSSLVLDAITKIEHHNITPDLLQLLAYPPKSISSEIENEIDFSRTNLPRLLQKVISVCHTSEESKYKELLRYCSLNSKPDLWLECMLVNLKSQGKSAILDELLFFIFEAQRLDDVISMCINSFEKSNKYSCLEWSARMICNIPTYVTNSFPHHRDLKLFNRTCFVETVLSSVKNNEDCSENSLLFLAYLATHLCLTGNSVELMNYIINSPNNSHQFWSKVFLCVQEKYLEMCILPLLSSSKKIPSCISLLSDILKNCDDHKVDVFMKLFRRLLFVRLLGTHNPARTIFSALCRVANSSDNIECARLIQKTDNLLGLPSVRLWSDSTSIQSSSVERHVYTCQVVLSWLTDFRVPLSSNHSNYFMNSLVPDILTGISNHLASPRDEIRVLGMAIGEWITERIELFPKSDQEHSLKFEYNELDVLSKVRPYFTPLAESDSKIPVPFEEKSPSIEDAKTSVDAPKSEVTINWKPKENNLDSDDDPDPEDSQEPSLQRLPCRPTGNLNERYNSNQLKKPRYLRECLDGMLMSKTEDNSINLACTLAATELIYSHPEAAKELAVEFARVLIHVQPPISSNQAEIDEARHKTLIAIGVVAPKECARYLTHEFNQSEYSVGQRLTILSALKSIACELAGGELSKSHVCSPDKIFNRSDSNPKTRRFFKKVEKPAHYINRFGPLAGEFFFPLLHSIPQLSKCSVAGHFAHQDSCLLANLLASLATIYACARFSSCQNRMAGELMELIPVLHRHPEPAVRRALFIAVGTVITVTPLDVLAANPQTLFSQLPTTSSIGDSQSAFLLNWLKASSESETDSECQILASSGLLALVERLGEIKIS